MKAAANLFSQKVAKATQCHIAHTMQLHVEKVDQSAVHRAIAKLCEQYGRGLILYGGQTATPQFFGFKSLRSLTNDIDFVVTEPVLEQLVTQEQLEYFPDFDVFFGYFEEVLTVFTCGHIHDYLIPQDFMQSTVTMQCRHTPVRVCSREYLIALKMRRGHLSSHHLFGKDAIDIINILAAGILRPELPPLDLARAAALTIELCGIGVLDFFNKLTTEMHHLPKQLWPLVSSEIFKFQQYCNVYGKHIDRH